MKMPPKRWHEAWEVDKEALSLAFSSNQFN